MNHMSRKNKGSILVVTVFVFLLVNIIAINCSSIVMSNIKYTKYNYEEINLREQCLSKIEVIYSNILKEVEIALDESNDFEDFNLFFISDNSAEFINKINDLSETSLDTKKCNITRINVNSQDYLYYKIESSVSYNKFIKTVVAYVKIKNPFEQSKQVEDTDELQEAKQDQELDEQIEGLDNALKESNDNITNKEVELNNQVNLGELQSSTQEQIKEDTEKSENEIKNEDNKQNIKPSDLVIIYECKEV